MSHIDLPNGKRVFISPQDEDVHTKVASEMFEVPAKHVTPEQRLEAKMYFFGYAYGART